MENQDFPLAKVQLFNWLLLAVLTGAAALAYSLKCAEGLLVGGLIANVSFLLLKNDLMKIFQGPVQAVKVRFFIKYYFRLSALAVLLYFLVRYGQLHVFGMLAGLSTVVLSICLVGLGLASNNLSSKEAV